MAVYWLIFVLPLAATLWPYRATPALSRVLLALIGLAFVVLIGLRYEVGPDWTPYATIYKNVSDGSFGDALIVTDPGYGAVNWFAGQLNAEFYVVQVVCASIFMAGVIYFARQQPLPWLAILISVPYLVNVVSMNLTRQSAAIGFELIALGFFSRGKLKQFCMFIILAALFHKTALFLLPFAAFATRSNRVAGLALWIALTVFGAVVAVLLEFYDYLVLHYFSVGLSSDGGATRLAMNIVPALLFLAYRHNFTMNDLERRLWTMFSIGSLACLPLLAVTSTGADRLALYFLPIQIAVFSRVPLLVSDRLLRSTIVLGLAVGYGAVQWVWLTYGTFAGDYLPYQFVPAL